MPDATVPPVVPPTVPPVTPKPAPPKKDGPHFAFLVEVAGPKNENLMCPIDSKVCRGKWARKNLHGKQFEGDFTAMPDLPGLCFVVNTHRRFVSRFDPLADEANAKLLKRAQRIALALDGIKRRAEKPFRWEGQNLTNDLLKTFVFWIRRMVDIGLMQVVKGTVPEWPEIRKMPGVIQLKPYDQMAGVERGVPDDKIRYMKPQPQDGDGDDRDELYMDEIPEPVISTRGMGGAIEESGDEDDDE